jgi:hypothetical protein
MSDFNIEIINPQNNTIEIENSLNNTITNLDIVLIDNTTLEIVNTEKILPSDFPNTYPFTSIIGDVPYTRVSGLTENTQDIIGSSLSGISGINISYNDNSGFTTISLSDPVINTIDIIDFNSGVSGLLPVKNISGSGYVAISSTTGNYIVSVTGLQPSGNYSLTGHSHTTSNISDFNTSVDNRITNANLQPSGNYSIVGHTHIISNISGLQTSLDGKQASGNYAASSHNHASSGITDFNSSVSGLLPITSLVASTGIGITQSGTVFTIATTGTFGLTQSQVDTRVNTLTSGVYASLISPSFIGTPLTPTASAGTNSTQIASTAFVRTEISNLVASAPSALDTLNELATALGNDASFSTTVTNNLAGKANLSGATFTGSISGPSGNFTSLKVNNVDVSANGHTHTSSNITNFNSSVSGLLPVGTANYLSKFGTGGSGLSNSLIFDNGTNVGIGTTNPTARLHVVGSGVFSSGIIVGDSSTNSYIYGPINPSTNNIRFNNGGADRIDFNSSNLFYNGVSYFQNNNYILRAGETTSTASQKDSYQLVFQNALWDGTASQYATSNIRSIASTSQNLISRLAFCTHNSVNNTLVERMCVTSSGGYVGIGTTTPSGQLHVVGTGLFESRVGIGNIAYTAIPSSILHIQGSVTNNASLMINTGLTTRTYLGAGNSDTNPFLSSVNGDLSASNYGWGFFDRGTEGDFRLSRKGGSTSWSDVISIQRTNGNVGIGTTTPQAPLEVSTSSDSDTGLRITNTNTSGTSARSSIILGNNGYTAGFTLGGQGNPNNSWLRPNRAALYSPFIMDYVTGQHYFWIGGSATQSAVSGSTNVIIIDSGSMHMLNGFPIDGGTAASSYLLLKSTSASGTSDSIRFAVGNNGGTEAMRITTNGSVGIGTTTPTYDLDVRTNSTNAFYVTQGGGQRYLLFGPNGFINNTTLAVSKTAWGNLASLEVNTVIPGRRGLVIEQVSSQTANAIETRDMASNVLSYISSSGGAYFANNVGIGTTNPQYKLDVNGNVNISGVLSISGVPLGEIIDDEVAGLLIAGSGISLNYNDSANTLIVDSNASTSLSGGNGVSLDYNSSSDTLVVNTVNFIHPFLLAGM